MDNTSHYDNRKPEDIVRFSLDELASALAEQQYQRSFLRTVTLKDCIHYYKKETEKLHSALASGFVLTVKKNMDPRNENDYYIVLQGLVDCYNRPITVNGESVSRILHTQTIDDSLIRALNGKDSCIFKV